MDKANVKPRTVRDRARRDAAAQAAHALNNAIRKAVERDYPNLTGYALRVPTSKIIRYGTGEDDWRWGAYRSAGQHAAAYEHYCERAVIVAASRISEVYGLGAGTAWAHSHFGSNGDERTAETQVLTSLASIRQNS